MKRVIAKIKKAKHGKADEDFYSYRPRKQLTVTDRESPYHGQIWEFVGLLRVQHGVDGPFEFIYLCRRTFEGRGTVTRTFRLDQVI